MNSNVTISTHKKFPTNFTTKTIIYLIINNLQKFIKKKKNKKKILEVSDIYTKFVNVINL